MIEDVAHVLHWPQHEAHEVSAATDAQKHTAVACTAVCVVKCRHEDVAQDNSLWVIVAPAKQTTNAAMLVHRTGEIWW